MLPTFERHKPTMAFLALSATPDYLTRDDPLHAFPTGRAALHRRRYRPRPADASAGRVPLDRGAARRRREPAPRARRRCVSRRLAVRAHRRAPRAFRPAPRRGRQRARARPRSTSRDRRARAGKAGPRLMPNTEDYVLHAVGARRASARMPASLRRREGPAVRRHHVVGPLDLEREAGRGPDAVRNRDAARERQERRGARGTNDHRDVQPGARRREPLRPSRPRPDVCAAATTVAPSGAPCSASVAATSLVDSCLVKEVERSRAAAPRARRLERIARSGGRGSDIVVA